MQDHDFRQSGEHTSAGSLKDSCLLCGKTEEAHSPKVVEQHIKILFQGRFYEFKNEEEAKKRGFYLG